MKKYRVLSLLTLITLLLGVMSACSKEVVEPDLEIYSYDEIKEDEVVIENDYLSFHFDPLTTQFKVVDKSTNHTWYSNPVDASEDPIATGLAKTDLFATISLKYNTESGSKTETNSFKDSVEKGNYTYEKIENGVRVNYTIADMAKVYIIPTGVGETRFKEFFDKIDASQQNMVLNNFKVYDPNKVKKSDNAEELAATYPAYADGEKVYVLRADINNGSLMAKVEGLFAEAGYTAEDYAQDTATLTKNSSSDKPMFNISVEYTLEDESLVVRVPLSEIKYKSKYPIVELKPLAYFGAANTEAEGFILVPEGSGGIINYNNGRQTQNVYVNDVYGRDYGEYKDSVIDDKNATFPVFGMSNENASFLCIIEKGSAHAMVEADVSGNLNNYNYATAKYNLIRSALMDISAKTDATVRRFQESLPDEDLVQRYIFIDKTDYSSMAVAYREYLLKEHPQLVKLTESKVPIAVELIGAVDRTKHIFGIPTSQPDELTSYKEAKEIIEYFVTNGVDGLNVKYNGWFNDGYLHTTPDKVKLVSELGSKKDFKNLVSYADSNNVNLYLAASFSLVYENGLFDSFNSYKNAARFVNREIALMYPYNGVYFGEDDSKYTYHLAKPSYYLKTMDSYAKEIEKLGVKNISFRDIGDVLGADYDTKNEVSREEAKNLQVAKLAELKEKGFNMMFSAGNMYSIPFANIVVNVDIDPVRHRLLDEEVPFLEIALHGIVPYTGKALNLSGEYKRAILKTVETGAGLYYTLMGADSFDLQDSKYVHYFSADFDVWGEDALSLYTRVKDELGHVYNQYMVKHEKLATNVYMTEYEDGTQVIVNYNSTAYNHNGKEVPALDFIVEGGKR